METYLWSILEDIGLAELPKSIKIIQAIKYLGTEESGIDDGVLYATANYLYKEQLKHDFVIVDVDPYESLAQLLCFIEITLPDTTIKIYAIVQYLQKATNKLNANYENYFFDLYKWEYAEDINDPISRKKKSKKSKQLNYNIGVIDVNSIKGPATVIPNFRNKVIHGSPRYLDEFYYVPLQFTDRSGWEGDARSEMQRRDITIINSDQEILSNKSIDEFLIRNRVSKLVNKTQCEQKIQKKRKRNFNVIVDEDENEGQELDFNEEDEFGNEIIDQTDNSRLASTKYHHHADYSDSDLE